MKVRILSVLCALFLSICPLSAKAPVSGNDVTSIIPAPAEMIVGEGNYSFKQFKVYIQMPDRQEDLMEMLCEKLSPATGFAAIPVSYKKANLRFIADQSFAKDAYSLSVDKYGATVRASEYGGFFYGLQTLVQLFPKDIKSSSKVDGIDWTIPFVEIKDSPSFAWRGLMLDVSRHWFTKEEVMRYIDEMSEYKFNIFHWHLTDDQGWRVQIKSCPELTAKGAKRATRVGNWWGRDAPTSGEPLDYGGFYTQDEIREVVAYAAKRNISVMPEIDVPGHSTALLVAHPELACFKAPEFVNVGHKFYGEEENSLCPGNETTFDILEKVFGEIAELFPFEYIHIGGDECFRGFWDKCPKCAARMEEEHLASTAELQSYFVKRVEKIVSSHGKKIVGWDEISDGGLAESATVMSWRGMDGGIKAAKAGHHVIMTPFEKCYLDLYQGEPSAEPATYSMLRLSDCYSFRPVPEGVDPSMILGGQGNLWAESVPVFRHAEYMTWPRGWALSEALWSPGSLKDWDDFIRRVEEHFKRAAEAGINYADKSMYNAIFTPSIGEDGGLRISLGSEIDDVKLYYTFDGTNPDEYSNLYTEPLSVPKNATTLNVQSYLHGEKVGTMIRLPIEQLAKRARQ